MFTLRTACSFSLSLVLFLVGGFFAVTEANTLPTATTVNLQGVAAVPEGTVVVAEEDTQTYKLSTMLDDPGVYGVTATQPPVVFQTGAGETPVITEGIAFVQVSNARGLIKRGDLLVSGQNGQAVRADEEHVHVFAIALEGFSGERGIIQAEIGVDRAQAFRTQQKKQQQAMATTTKEETVQKDGEQKKPFAFVRGFIATILVIGALGFLLYSFRSLLTHGIISIGRNPRAKGSIMTFSFANIVFALLLCAVIVFIAVAILILPL